MTWGVNFTAVVGNPVYVKWACFSAKTVKEFMPEVRTSLYTNRSDEVEKCEWGGCIDDILDAPDYVLYDSSEESAVDAGILRRPMEDLQGAMIDGIIASENLGYDVTLFTGADTVFCDDITDIFDLMGTGKFDLGLTLPRDQRKRKYPLRGIHPGFPYYRDGVLIFPWNDAVRKFMGDWQRLWTSHKVECAQYRKPGCEMHPTIPAINEALYRNSNLRLVFLASNYCATFWTGCLYGKAKILHVHGAGARKAWKMAKRLNRDSDRPRVFRERKLL